MTKLSNYNNKGPQESELITVMETNKRNEEEEEDIKFCKGTRKVRIRKRLNSGASNIRQLNFASFCETKNKKEQPETS